jgi:hypothetical protein
LPSARASKAERERQRLVGAHAVVVVAEIGVADAAAGDLHDHLAGAGFGAKRGALELRARGGHQPAAGADRHGGLLLC